MPDDRDLPATHEAGHGVVAHALGRRVGLLTIEPSEYRSGCCWSSAPGVTDALPWCVEEPLLTWAAGWQSRLAADVAVLMAGSLAEAAFTPRMSGRSLPSAIDETRDRLAELATMSTEAEREYAAASASTPGASDEDEIAKITFTAHGGSLAEAWPWLAYVESQATAILAVNKRKVRTLADLLLEHTTLGAAAVARVLGDAR